MGPVGILLRVADLFLRNGHQLSCHGQFVGHLSLITF